MFEAADLRPFDLVGKVGRMFFEQAHRHGLVTRAVGDSIAFFPPLVITESEIDELVVRFARTFEEI
jgi:4-aminobutyrate--pyruvate transaminase